MAACLLAAAAVAASATLPIFRDSGPANSLSTLPDQAAVADLPQALPRTTASSWSATPVFEPAAAAPAFAPEAAALAGEIGSRYGVTIVLSGQDWGADTAVQQRNLAAVAEALERLPAKVRGAITGAGGGPILVLSNANGRTAGGWQPYGNGAHSFYTNTDEAAGTPVARQVVLATGAGPITVAHELLHAYQLRDVPPGRYALALLGDEMRSFMAATGWTQTGTDAQVEAAAGSPWGALSGFFRYEGRALTYTAGDGSAATLSPENPLEAYATAGALYYARPAGAGLPDWPEYWAWFRANLR